MKKVDAELINFNLKMEPAYHDWFNGLADRLRLPLTNLVDLALATLASREGHTPPPRRVPSRRRVTS